MAQELSDWIHWNAIPLDLAALEALIPHKDYLKDSSPLIDTHFLIVDVLPRPTFPGEFRVVSAEIETMERLRESYKAFDKEEEFEIGMEASRNHARDEEDKMGVKLAGVIIILVRCPGMMHIRSINILQAAVDVRKGRTHNSEWVTRLKMTAVGRKGKKVKI